jgi:CheY-like chemotaxis protein
MKQDMAGANPEGGEGGGRRIAIVEDEMMVAWSLETMAEELGHVVTGVFATGESAIEALSRDPPDLLFMDINLGGGIDGVETARRLRHAHPVRVLFISAYADEETRGRVREAVPDARLLGKPVRTLVLKQAIDEATGTAG